MISYEISLGLSLVPVLLIFGELNLGKIVEEQSRRQVATIAFLG